MGFLGINIILALLSIAGANVDWWEHAVVYQVYHRSFFDSDKDGIGDIPGMIEKAEFFSKTGVDAVWLSPMFESPQEDFGFDVKDYMKIDSRFGTIDDLIKLIKTLHSRGIKVLMSLVPNHTSKLHNWFIKSEKGDPKYKDYYVWAEGTSKTPPNNWVSHYGGSAWSWSEKRGMWYLHQFLDSQPDLNYRNEDVKTEMKKILQQWVFHGIDGFIMDSSYALVEASTGSDWSKCQETDTRDNCNDISDYNCIWHKCSADQEETFGVIRELREHMDSLPDGADSNVKNRVMIAESSNGSSWDVLKKYLEYKDKNNKYGAVANLVFNDLFLSATQENSAEDWRNIIKSWFQNKLPSGKRIRATWMLGNHNFPRVASRLGKESVDLLNIMTLLLRGTAFTYNGEEIGMTNTYVKPDETEDPVAKTFYYRSRDPERGPFLWNSTLKGFTANDSSWLPANTDIWQVNLEAQNKTQDNRTHFQIYKQMTELRKTLVLQEGANDMKVLNKSVLAIFRSLADNPTVVGLFNLGSKTETVDIRKERPNLPYNIYLYIRSLNIMDDKKIKYGARFNSTEVVLPPKGAMVFLTQDLSIPILSYKNDIIQLK